MYEMRPRINKQAHQVEIFKCSNFSLGLQISRRLEHNHLIFETVPFDGYAYLNASTKPNSWQIWISCLLCFEWISLIKIRKVSFIRERSLGPLCHSDLHVKVTFSNNFSLTSWSKVVSKTLNSHIDLIIYLALIVFRSFPHLFICFPPSHSQSGIPRKTENQRLIQHCIILPAARLACWIHI